MSDLSGSRRKIWFWGILALVILLVLCVWRHMGSIPTDIESRARAALTAGGFDPRLLSAVEGRDLILSGDIDERIDRKKLLATVRNVRGVRGLSDNLKLIPLGNARLSLKANADKVVLQGILPDQAAVDEVVAAATRAYGAENTSNQLSVQDRLREPIWIGGLAEMIAELSQADPVTIEADQNGVILVGKVASADIQNRIEVRSAELFGDKVPLQSQLTVKPPPVTLVPARITIARDADRLVLQGELADQAAIDSILAAAQQLVDPAKVDNKLTVGQNIAPAVWLDELLGLVPALKELADARMAADADGLSISGTMDSDSKKSAFLQRARKAAGEFALNHNLQVLVPKESAKLSVRKSAEKLILSGELPDQAGIDRVLKALASHFETDHLVNELKAVDTVSEPEWLNGVLELFGDVAAVAQGGIEADDRHVLLVGTVESQDQRTMIGQRAETLLGKLPIDNRLQIQVPAPPKPPSPPPLIAKPQFPPLYLKHDSTELVPASQTVLTDVVDLLIRYPDLRLEVGAHTDAAGDEIYNQWLSERRAQDMIRILSAAGIEKSRLIPKGYGEFQPLADNATTEGRALNRRIELKVLD